MIDSSVTPAILKFTVIKRAYPPCPLPAVVSAYTTSKPILGKN
jgi:hypothetical protein